MLNVYIEAACTNRNPVKLITTNGYQMCGIILEHNHNAILLLCGNVKKLIFIHAISTIEHVKNNENKA